MWMRTCTSIIHFPHHHDLDHHHHRHGHHPPPPHHRCCWPQLLLCGRTPLRRLQVIILMIMIILMMIPTDPICRCLDILWWSRWITRYRPPGAKLALNLLKADSARPLIDLWTPLSSSSLTPPSPSSPTRTPSSTWPARWKTRSWRTLLSLSTTKVTKLQKHHEGDGPDHEGPDQHPALHPHQLQRLRPGHQPQCETWGKRLHSICICICIHICICWRFSGFVWLNHQSKIKWIWHDKMYHDLRCTGVFRLKSKKLGLWKAHWAICVRLSNIVNCPDIRGSWWSSPDRKQEKCLKSYCIKIWCKKRLKSHYRAGTKLEIFLGMAIPWDDCMLLGVLEQRVFTQIRKYWPFCSTLWGISQKMQKGLV